MKQLIVFDAVARLGSVSRAAEEIALTHSAVSMALKDLESRLGTELFHREAKRLLLNDMGRRLQPKVSEVLAGARDIEAEAKTEGSERSYLLKIGASMTIGNYLLPELCDQFTKLNPHVRVSLTVLASEEVAEKVAGLAFDLGFLDFPVVRPSLRSTRWLADELVIFGAADHPLASRASVAAADLAGETWRLLARPSMSRVLLMRGLLSHVETVDAPFESNSVEAIKRMVVTGGGLGCLSSRTIGQELKDGVLAKINTDWLDLSRMLTIIQHSRVRSGEMATAFLAHAMAAARTVA